VKFLCAPRNFNVHYLAPGLKLQRRYPLCPCLTHCDPTVIPVALIENSLSVKAMRLRCRPEKGAKKISADKIVDKRDLHSACAMSWVACSPLSCWRRGLQRRKRHDAAQLSAPGVLLHFAIAFCVSRCLHGATAKCREIVMRKTRDVVREMLNPIRHNDLKARRKKLGLSRVALGRILGVDPATVFRREQGVLAPLWDYALSGIEAEAQEGKSVVKGFKSGLDLQSFEPDQLAARGYAYTAEKMLEEREKHAHTKRHPPRPRAAPPPEKSGHRAPTKAQIKAAADRAEARSRQPG
jgi:DNA-binding XRE family transcriptional regulator